MYNAANVVVTIDSLYYQKLLNNVILKAPIEVGIEILAFMLIEDFVSRKGLTLIDVSRFPKKNAKSFGVIDSEEGAVPDYVVVSNEYRYKNDSGCYGFVEIKEPSVKISLKTTEYKAHIKVCDHVLFTNGIVWKYIDKDENQSWEILLDSEGRQRVKSSEVTIVEEKFSELLIRLNKIHWG